MEQDEQVQYIDSVRFLELAAKAAAEDADLLARLAR